VQNIGAHPYSNDIRRLMDLPATTDLGDLGAFSGGPPPVPGGPGAVPSRLVLQQLYDAGMLDALPDDVQGMLRRGGAGRGPIATPIDLALEARDPRMASDVVFQFLAFRHHDTLNAPVNVQSLYFTFQFYHFAPTTTTMAYLVAPNPAQMSQMPGGQQQQQGGAHAPGMPPAPDPTTVNATRILVTNHPNRKGAGEPHAAAPNQPSHSPRSTLNPAHSHTHIAHLTYLHPEILPPHTLTFHSKKV
jgi:hypothetical protein